MEEEQIDTGETSDMSSEEQSSQVRVLVADQESHVAELFSVILAGVEHELLFTESGEKALEILGEQHIDLAILDAQLPDCSGLILCNALKSAGTSFIPVVLTSNHADPFARIEALKQGADAYMTKPFFAEEFQVILSSLLRLKDFTDQVIAERDELAELEERLTMKLYDLGKL